MSDEKTYTVEEAHKLMAIKTNGVVWQLLEKQDRSKSDDDLMVHAAHASCYHWLQAGTNVHHQRAHWLLSHVYAELNFSYPSLRHAQRCMELTLEFIDQMQDFDLAYANEALARANACRQNKEEALYYLQNAEAAGNKITSEEDRKIFFSDLQFGNWYGLK
jgi:hypothetical protein